MSEKREITLVVNGRSHSIRIDPQGNVWTTDAASSMVYKFTPEGKKLMEFEVGGQPTTCGTFCSVTDIAFAPNVMVNGEAVRSCLMFAVQAEGCQIRTVEGLANGDELHPLQQAFIDHHGLQCGFCTPGFLMLAAGVLERDPNINDEDLLDLLASNLCRCTGYQNIVKAVRAAAIKMGARR